MGHPGLRIIYVGSSGSRSAVDCPVDSAGSGGGSQSDCHRFSQGFASANVAQATLTVIHSWYGCMT